MYTISGKVLTPFFAIVLLLSMVPTITSHNSAILQRSNVKGFWEDLFGPDGQGTPEVLFSGKDSAANDIFLKITGIDGESTDDRHPAWIEVLSFSMGMSHIWSGGSDQLFMEDIVLVKIVDKASPKLMEKCATSELISSVVIDFSFSTGDKVTYYKYELEDVLVSSFYCSGDSNDYKPTETVTLSFEWIKVTYTEFDITTGSPKGNVEFTWDLELGRTG